MFRRRLLAILALAAAGLGGLAAATSSPPCLRLGRAGTAVQGDVRICPGQYRIADPDETGVIVIASAGTRLDLSDVMLTSGDRRPSEFVGVGVFASNLDNLTIIGGRISGYRFGIRIHGGAGHSITHADVSGSRAQRLRSDSTIFDERDWLDIFRPDTFNLYGGGLLLMGTTDAVVQHVTARGAQNGIGLMHARGTIVRHNDVSGNSGWGIHLWHSAHNIIADNAAHHNVRCEAPSYRRGCDSAALLLREASDSNLISDNDLSYSGDGFFLSGHRPYVRPSIGNLVVRNDASHAWHNGFESTFSFGNTFIDNRADSADYGFWLGYSTANVVEGNSMVGTRTAGIAIEHGADNTVSRNLIVGGPTGIRLFAPGDSAEPSRDYRVDDNVLARLDTGVVLRRTARASLRGNLFDGVVVGLVADQSGSTARVRGNIFLRASVAFIQADTLDAGGNYWAAANADSTRAKTSGAVTVLPWFPAREAGY